MSEYVGLSIETDPDVLMDEAVALLSALVPGFVPKEAHLEVWLLETVARMTAETRYLFTLVSDGIFRYFGESLVNIPPIDGDYATALTTWTMINNAGYTISAGTQVAYRVAGDKRSVFYTVEDVVIPPGSTSATNVLIQSPILGSAQNGLGPAGIELVDSLAYVSTVTAAAATAGGVDPETNIEYLSRLRNEMTLLSPRFVLAADAAVLARRIPGVARALGIDNYNPGTLTFGNEKTMTLAVVGEDGLPLSAGIKTSVDNYLQSLRELNFVLYVVDPTYTTINVTFIVVAQAGYDLTTVDNLATAAVTEYLSPANWAGGSETPPAWRAETVVRYLEVAEVLNRVDGVSYIDTLTVNGGTANVTLAGVAPLPTVGTITGSAISG